MKAVEHLLVREPRWPIGEGVRCRIPAGIRHHRRRRIDLADRGDDGLVEGFEIRSAALLGVVPGLHRLRIGVLGKAIVLFRCRFVDDVVGGDRRVVLQFARKILPEARGLVPPGLVLPEPAVELVAVVLGPAHARQ
ncbi:hypothetical protein D9M72_559080 [compost metagenome]